MKRLVLVFALIALTLSGVASGQGREGIAAPPASRTFRLFIEMTVRIEEVFP